MVLRRLGLIGTAVTAAIVVLAGSAQQPRILFTDQTASSGITFVLNNCPTQHRYLPETMAGGIAAFDFDGDGKLDLFFANGADMPSLDKTGPQYADRLYHNDGPLHFTDVTTAAGLAGQGYSIGAAAADFDNDGRIDLFVAGVNGSHLYRNLGGRFEDVTTSSGLHENRWTVSAAWFDYDRDGLLDLLVVHYVQWSPDLNPI